MKQLYHLSEIEILVLEENLDIRFTQSKTFIDGYFKQGTDVIVLTERDTVVAACQIYPDGRFLGRVWKPDPVTDRKWLFANIGTELDIFKKSLKKTLLVSRGRE